MSYAILEIKDLTNRTVEDSIWYFIKQRTLFTILNGNNAFGDDTKRANLFISLPLLNLIDFKNMNETKYSQLMI